MVDDESVYLERRVLELESLLAEQSAAAAQVTAREREAQEFSKRLARLHALSIRLSEARSIDGVCRMAVEHGRVELGFDRLSIWLYNADLSILTGTYGTDETGEIRDERGALWPRGDLYIIQFNEHDSPVNIRKDGSIYDYRGNIIGGGWNLTGGIRDGRRVIGILCADNYINGSGLTDNDCEILGLFAATIGHVIAKKRRTETLRAIIDSTSCPRSHLFESMVVALANLLGAKYAFLGEFADADMTRIRTIKTCDNGVIAPNFEYDLTDTPCANVVNQKACFYPSGITQLFPNDLLLVQMGVDSYLGAPLQASTGEPLGILVVLHERPISKVQDPVDVVTLFASHAAAELERLRSEELVRSHEESIRALLNATQENAFLIDCHGTLIALNQAMGSDIGFDSSAMLGKSIFDFLPDHLVDSRTQAIDTVIATGKPIQFEDCHKDIWLENSIYPILDQHGKVSRIAVYARNISDQKLASRAIEEREALYRNAIQIADGVVYQINLNPREYTFVGDGIEKLTGYTREEFTPKLFDAIVVEIIGYGAQAGRTYDEAIRQAVETNFQKWTADYQIRTKQGEMVWLSDRSIGILSDGRTTAALGILQDITERKRLEEDLIRSQRLDALGQLSAGVAHDFNNLITAVKGYTRFAQQQIDPGNGAYEDLSQILKVSERAEGLTRQLLSFARKQVEQPALIQVNDNLAGVEELLRPLIGKGIDLIIATASDLWPVEMNPGQLDQVILNLAINGRDAMPTGGKLTITAENVTLDEGGASLSSVKRPGAYIRIRVMDTGCGMSDDTLAHVFEPFFTTKPIGSGTGLGLSTCLGIVKQADGYICIDTEIGVGTTVEIYLPRAAGLTETSEASASYPTAGGEILVLEDSPLVIEIIRHALERAGYTVLRANTRAEAIELVERKSSALSLLITGGIMPRMRGAGAEISDLCPSLPVLYVCSSAEYETLFSGTQSGSRWFLEKPFTDAELVDKVRQVLDYSARSVKAD